MRGPVLCFHTESCPFFLGASTSCKFLGCLAMYCMFEISLKCLNDIEVRRLWCPGDHRHVEKSKCVPMCSFIRLTSANWPPILPEWHVGFISTIRVDWTPFLSLVLVDSYNSVYGCDTKILFWFQLQMIQEFSGLFRCCLYIVLFAVCILYLNHTKLKHREMKMASVRTLYVRSTAVHFLGLHQFRFREDDRSLIRSPDPATFTALCFYSVMSRLLLIGLAELWWIKLQRLFPHTGTGCSFVWPQSGMPEWDHHKTVCSSSPATWRHCFSFQNVCRRLRHRGRN